MLENLMEDKKLDLDAQLLSVRRFSAGSVASATSTSNPVAKSGEKDRKPAAPPPRSRRSSLPFYKSDVKTGPVRHPGAIPFVWEQTPGQPKSSAFSTPFADGGVGVGRTLVASRPPPGRSFYDKGRVGAHAPAAAPTVKPGTSVRTRKAVSFAPVVNEITSKYSEKLESGPTQKVSVEKEKEKDQQPMPTADHNLVNEEVEDEEEEEEEDDEAFSDALDTLSRAESIFLNCSVSGISGIKDSDKPSASFSTDPQVRDFMMGRFLPAAQAMASSSPQYTFRKPAAPALMYETTRPSGMLVGGDYRKPPPVPLQQKLYNVSRYIAQQKVGDICDEDNNYEEDENYYEETAHLSFKACGLLPKFCLLNPLPAMKPHAGLPPQSRRRIGRPQVRSSQTVSHEQSVEEHSWEAVYRHKLGQGYQPEVEDGRSKLTSESNQLTYSSDSPTADGSSPYRRSTGGLSPFRNEAPTSPFREGKGFLGVPSRESKSSKTYGSDGRLSSGSGSPALEKTLYVDSASMLEAADSKSSSFSAFTFIKGVSYPDEKDSEIGYGNQSIEESLLIGELGPKVSEIVTLGLPFEPERICQREAYGDDKVKQNVSDNDILHSKAGDLINSKASAALQPLLPPPLPKTPSESWLSRTLPSRAPKNTIPQSLLGISQPRKQARINLPSVDLRLQPDAKPSKLQRHQLKFTEVLAKPVSPKSGI